MSVVKPKIDESEYEHMILPNGLKVLLIHNKTTDISAAAMVVNAGFYQDPPNIPGLAHFLEHMLFMGTEFHKQENHFHQFISETGGVTNAHTMEELTNYYFQVFNEHFIKVLEIFSYFFISPLFSEDAIDREINSVNSEHKKNLTSEMFRANSILRELSNQNHAFSKFGTGTIKTLNKSNIRSYLFTFHKKYYCAKNMKLVIFSNKSLSNEVKKYFGDKVWDGS